MTGLFHCLVSGMVLVLSPRQGHYSRVFYGDNLAGQYLYQPQNVLRHCPVWRLLYALPVYTQPFLSCCLHWSHSPSEAQWKAACSLALEWCLPSLPHNTGSSLLLPTPNTCFHYSESEETSHYTICVFQGTENSQGQVPLDIIRPGW